jgi:hypothetical protein
MSLRRTGLWPVAALAHLVLVFACATPPPIPEDAVELPAVFYGERIFVTPVTTTGETLHLYTDTGGGLFLQEAAVERLGLPVREVTRDGQTVRLAPLPELRPDAWIPPVPGEHDPSFPGVDGLLYVIPAGQAFSQVGDGMLGQAWFGNGVWTFDYPGKRLFYHASAGAPAPDPPHTVALGFKTDETGRRETHFPSLEATVDGETLPFLLDTGAMVRLTDAALAVLDDEGPATRATSFITETVFDRWRRRHPGWPVIENADRTVSGAPMIQVPEVAIAGHTVGPVWFTRRPDRNFHEFMARMMDREVEGALGGSLFRYFVLTVDYPGARATFRRP